MERFPQPEAVFRYFTALSAIPHGSGNTAAVSAWALDTAQKLSLEAHADALGNVIIRKPASAGYEQHPGVILQGHLDMVCAKLPECKKDMEHEAIDLIWDEEFLSADGTTLGGDDGIAVAYAFAILEDDSIPHPPLTVIFTIDEETGMEGATSLAPENLTGTYLLNVDSEEEGIFTVGCAGGVRVHMHLPVTMHETTGTRIRLTLSGLTGGHSGAEIHKPLLNADLVMHRLLSAVQMPFSLSEWQGGVRDNVIPTDCNAALLTAPDQASEICAMISRAFEAVKAENPQEAGIMLHMQTEPDASGTAVDHANTASLLRQIGLLPNGVQEMNPRLNLPETSLNLGIFDLQKDEMLIDALIRSGSNAKRDALAAKLHALTEASDGTAADSGIYPAWEYIPDTALEQTAVEVYRRMYGKEPVVETIHAGLECGILSAKAPQLQCISIGPDLFDIHTPRERLSLASARRTWEFILELLKAL